MVFPDEPPMIVFFREAAWSSKNDNLEKKETNSMLVTEKANYFVVVSFCFCFSHLFSQRTRT